MLMYNYEGSTRKPKEKKDLGAIIKEAMLKNSGAVPRPEDIAEADRLEGEYHEVGRLLDGSIVRVAFFSSETMDAVEAMVNDALEASVEGREVVGKWESLEGEECYQIYSLDTEYIRSADKLFVISCTIPGMVDHTLVETINS